MWISNELMILVSMSASLKVFIARVQRNNTNQHNFQSKKIRVNEMRRLHSATAKQVSPVARREFRSMVEIVWICGIGVVSVTWGAMVANALANHMTYGRFRFKNQLDDPFLVHDFKLARYAGGFLGLIFWWFKTGRDREHHYLSSAMQVPTNKHIIGPF